MAYFQLRSGVLSQQVGSDTLLMDVNSGSYFELNPTGAWILSALVAGKSSEQISQALAEEFDVSPEQARLDCEKLLAELVAAELIRSQSGAVLGSSG